MSPVYICIGHGRPRFPPEVGGPPPALIAGEIAATADDEAMTITVTQVSPPAGGIGPPYTAQLYRSNVNGQKGSAVDGVTSLPYEDEDIEVGTPYYYTLEVSDGASFADTAQAGAVLEEIDLGPEPDMIEDYSTYTNTSNFLSDPRGIYRLSSDNTTSQMLIDTSVHDAGYSQSLRYRYLHGGSGANSITIRRQLVFPSPVEEVWAEFRFKYSTNFTTANPAAPNDHKLIFGDTQAGANGRWAFYIGSDGSDVFKHTLMVETPWRTAGSSHKPGTGLQGAYYMTSSPGWAEDIWESGLWQTVRFHLKSTTTGAIYRLWLNGVLRHNETGFGVGDTNGSPDKIEGFSWCHNKDDGPPGVEMFLWWQWAKFWFSSPGWEGDS